MLYFVLKKNKAKAIIAKQLEINLKVQVYNPVVCINIEDKFQLTLWQIYNVFFIPQIQYIKKKNSWKWLKAVENSLFQHISAYSSYSSLFQSIPSNSSIFQPI